jgi:hypothetical protein
MLILFMFFAFKDRRIAYCIIQKNQLTVRTIWKIWAQLIFLGVFACLH